MSADPWQGKKSRGSHCASQRARNISSNVCANQCLRRRAHLNEEGRFRKVHRLGIVPRKWIRDGCAELLAQGDADTLEVIKVVLECRSHVDVPV